MSRKWSLMSGADTQVCWSFHLHIKCYLVSYRAPAAGRGSEGRQLLLRGRGGAMRGKTGPGSRQTAGRK